MAFVSVTTFSAALCIWLSNWSPKATASAIAPPLLVFPLSLISLVDDRGNLSPVFRFAMQLLTALVLIFISPLSPSMYAWPLLMIAITAVINFTNFMDGLDGLVAGCMSIAFSTAALKLDAPLPYWALVGALLGFLVWNWSPAKVFMGDVGSIYLGAVFAGLVLQASSWSLALGLLLVATPMLGDAFFCVLRRYFAGQSVWTAHRLHLFQRLHQAGWSHARVSALYIAATALLGVALLLGSWRALIPLALFELMLGFYLDQRVALPFALASST